MAIERPSRLIKLTCIVVEEAEKDHISVGSLNPPRSSGKIFGHKLRDEILRVARPDGSYERKKGIKKYIGQIEYVEYSRRRDDSERFTYAEYIAMGRKPVIAERREFMGVGN